MREEDLKRYWYPAYNDALKLLKNSNRVSEKHIAQMVKKYGNTVFNRLFCLVVWQEIKRIRTGNPSLKVNQYPAAIGDAWKLFKDHASPNDAEEYWDELVNAIHIVLRKYDDCRFMLDLVVNVTLEEIERIWRENKRGCNE